MMSNVSFKSYLLHSYFKGFQSLLRTLICKALFMLFSRYLQMPQMYILGFSTSQVYL